MTKLWYSEERPFWVDTEIKAYNCNNQFGNPSGHAQYSMGMLFLLWLEFNEKGMEAEAGKWYKSIWVRAIAMLLVLTFGFSIGWSRLFLGVHAWN